MLRRYWITFAPEGEPSPLNLGCGITAHDQSQAEIFLENEVFPLFGRRSIAQIVEGIDVSTLEENHVRPNMGSPAVIGVWFPALQR